MKHEFELSAKILKTIIGILLLILVISLNVAYIFTHVMRTSILITLGVESLLLAGCFMGLILGVVMEYEGNDSKKSQ